MPSFFPIQTAFHAGEISDRSRGRLDLPLYKFGLARCENLRPTPQGSLLMRAGTEKVRVLTGGDSTRLIRFRMTDTQDYILELAQMKMRIYSILTGAEENVTKRDFAQNGVFDGPGGWTQTANGSTISFDSGQLGLKVDATPVNDHIPRVTQKINFSAAGVALISVKCIKRVGDLAPDASHILRLGTTPGGAEIFETGHEILLAEPVENLVVYALGQLAVVAPGVDYYATLTVDPHVTEPGEMRIAWFDDFHAILEAEAGLDIDTPWTDDQLAALQFEAEPGIDRIIFVHPDVQPWTLRYVEPGWWDYGAVTFSGIPLLDPTYPANGPAWSDENGWPGTVEVYNGRVYLAGWRKARNRFWASRSGTAFDFTTGTNAGDALDYKIATKGSIKWIRGQRTLLAGTDITEHSISGSAGVPDVGDTQIKEESAFGSANMPAINAGTNALFVTSDRRELRALAYDLQTGGWDSKAVTFFAEHLTAERDGSPIREFHHVRHPEGSIVCVLDAGNVIVCAFDPSENVVAWWRVNLPGAQVLTGAVSNGPLGAFFWMVVKRGAALILERLPLADKAGLRYLDASVEGTVVPVPGPPGQAWVPGLEHLANGTVVRVLIDGELLGDFPVVDGYVYLDPEHVGKTAAIGLPFRAKAVTLPLEGGNPGGTAQGFKVHYSDITARLNNSAPPLLNGARAGSGRPFSAPLDTAEPLVTADLSVSSMKVEEGGAITIEQDLPFRTEICALYARAHISKL
jgi:hypothetical protein